ncbi:hypothetical protein SORBI_3005G124300 [Sorghum bicolor]|uniref:Uncharacterized protein n=1 Tax=Sorghum bicolor TaxID=4558 RepID=A0A1B6PS06_SORBI|nr:hypothetical protein SORBI_3005G124300 [Sorghum bicolor]
MSCIGAVWNTKESVIFFKKNAKPPKPILQIRLHLPLANSHLQIDLLPHLHIRCPPPAATSPPWMTTAPKCSAPRSSSLRFNAGHRPQVFYT